MNLNKIMLIGRVTKRPKETTLPSGKAVSKFSLATNRNYKDKNGKKVEKATFHNIAAFGRTAEIINQYVVKGQEIYVEGRQSHRSYDKKDGTRGYFSEVVVRNFQFGQKPKGTSRPEEPATSDRKAPEPSEIDDIPF